MEHQELATLFRAVFETDDGKRVFEEMAKRFYMFQNTYNNMDTHDTAFREGQRSVVLFIRQMILTKERLPETIEE